MNVSVIIPCYNEEEYINDCLYSIIENNYDLNKLEILVVDGGSTDNTISIINKIQEKYRVVQILNNPKKRTPFALNIGLEKAKNEYVLIAGAHAKYPKGYIQELTKLISESNIDVVGGIIKTCVKNTTPKTKAIKFVLTNKFGVGSSVFRIGADELKQADTVPFGLYPKKVLIAEGGYNTKLIRNHDIELSKRILSKGYKIWITPKYSVDYFARETFKKLAQNNYRNGFWNARTFFITKNINSLSFRHYVPLCFILSILFPAILSTFLNSYIILISVFVLFLYWSFLFTIALKNKKTQSFKQIIFAFHTLHFSYGIGTLMGLIKSSILWSK